MIDRPALDSVRVRAVVVTFNPELDRLRAVLAAVGPQVEGVLVVDNGSDNRPEIEELVRELPEVELEMLGANRGIATALNVGVERVLPSADWLLTLDQDTVVHAGAVATVFHEFNQLPDDLRANCVVLAMSRFLPPPQGFRRRWIQRYIVVAEYERFREMNTVITSGNLVRASAFSGVRYNDELFIDHVDTAFCVDVRRAGGRILEFRQPTMEHRLGRMVETRRGRRTYEGGIRIYYITRNGFTLVLRREMPARVFLRDVIGFSRVYVDVNGARSAARCLRMVLCGIRDGSLGHLGPRDDDLRPMAGTTRTAASDVAAAVKR